MAQDPGAALRALHRPGDPFVLANAWDAGSARMLAALGAQAIGTTSAGFAFTLGLPDGARITRDQALAHAEALVAATSLPVSGDLENGYGEDPDEVAETIRLAAEVGLAGASIEDTDLPGDGAYWFRLAIERVQAAAAAARALPGDFVLCARADGLMTGAYDLDEALRRIEGFAEAGADCVYIPLLPDIDAVRRTCAAVAVPVNVLVTAPLTACSRGEFAAAGAARLSLGSGLARLAQAALRDAGRDILDQGDFRRLADGASGSEIDALLAEGTPK
jgi:2-methylisocitrate lyase-like PEP mutase family enzyme